jgi:hypothetical protein
MMPAYPVICYRSGCGEPAVYKVASRWSDGIIGELKTYALTCPACLAEQYARARAKRAACRLAQGEILEEPGVYELARGQRDHALVRRSDLEEQLAASIGAASPS